MNNIANADRPKSAGAMLPPRLLRGSGKVAQTACNSDRREGKSCIPTLNQTFADSRILKISKFRTFRIAVGKLANWHPLRALAPRAGEPDRSPDIRKLFRGLDSLGTSSSPSTARPRAAPTTSERASKRCTHQRLRDQRPSDVGANQRAREDQRD